MQNIKYNLKKHIRSNTNQKTSIKHYQQPTKYRQYQQSSNYAQLCEQKLRETDSTLSCKTQSIVKNSIANFIKIKKLGCGKFGQVHLVIHRKTGFIGALKTIQKKNLNSNEKMMRQLTMEIKIQSYIRHSNLIELYTFFADEKNVYLLMELGCDGQLYALMQKKQSENQHFTQQGASFLIRQVLEGLASMHKQGVIHRDIKPQNIVVAHGIPKICDFGCSVYCPMSYRSTVCGTPLYLPPEIISGNIYNEKIDTWAIGSLTYQLLTGNNPFKITQKEHLTRIVTQDFQMEFGSKHVRSFLTKCLKKDPESRPNTATLLRHIFIRKYEELETSEQLCQ